ncbi:MAG TPA: pilus assembly protein PilF [Sphaerochaeta sp.]|nr:pilus assembly protein PilF [Sphaerochaeta sp.]HQB53831.1 pilus assembly protein PilF [Sphaerochaeta sp.]
MKIRNLGLYISIGVTVLIVALPISKNAKLIILFGAFAGFLFYRRGIMYYSNANKKLQSGALDEAWVLYRKALKAGVAPNLRVSIASMFIQRGDVDEGKSILESYNNLTKGRTKELDAVVKILLSMVHWIEGDTKTALQTVREVYEAGFRDSGLLINYTTFALMDRKWKEAEKLLDEAEERGMTSPGLVDNRAWLAISKNEWVEAELILTDLISRGPRFAEPYLHLAQVKIHWGLVGEAIDLLAEGLKKQFVNTSGVKAEYIQDLHDRLSDPQTRRKTATEIDQDRLAVAAGQEIKPIDQTFEPEEGLTLTGFAKRPAGRPKLKTKPEEEGPNLELTAEDLAYIEANE